MDFRHHTPPHPLVTRHRPDTPLLPPTSVSTSRLGPHPHPLLGSVTRLTPPPPRTSGLSAHPPVTRPDTPPPPRTSGCPLPPAQDPLHLSVSHPRPSPFLHPTGTSTPARYRPSPPHPPGTSPPHTPRDPCQHYSPTPLSPRTFPFSTRPVSLSSAP